MLFDYKSVACLKKMVWLCFPSTYSNYRKVKIPSYCSRPFDWKAQLSEASRCLRSSDWISTIRFRLFYPVMSLFPLSMNFIVFLADGFLAYSLSIDNWKICSNKETAAIFKSCLLDKERGRSSIFKSLNVYWKLLLESGTVPFVSHSLNIFTLKIV